MNAFRSERDEALLAQVKALSMGKSGPMTDEEKRSLRALALEVDDLPFDLSGPADFAPCLCGFLDDHYHPEFGCKHGAPHKDPRPGCDGRVPARWGASSRRRCLRLLRLLLGIYGDGRSCGPRSLRVLTQPRAPSVVPVSIDPVVFLASGHDLVWHLTDEDFGGQKGWGRRVRVLNVIQRALPNADLRSLSLRASCKLATADLRSSPRSTPSLARAGLHLEGDPTHNIFAKASPSPTIASEPTANPSRLISPTNEDKRT